MIEVRCIAKQPYAPPEDLIQGVHAPWKPGETRILDDESAMRLLMHDSAHFMFVRSPDHPAKKPFPEPAPEIPIEIVDTGDAPKPEQPIPPPSRHSSIAAADINKKKIRKGKSEEQVNGKSQISGI